MNQKWHFVCRGKIKMFCRTFLDGHDISLTPSYCCIEVRFCTQLQLTTELHLTGLVGLALVGRTSLAYILCFTSTSSYTNYTDLVSSFLLPAYMEPGPSTNCRPLQMSNKELILILNCIAKTFCP